ncbi:hypothetical protein [Streptomyces sp. NPDC000983]|uniref:hypothetical protein n=1 Tax=Streptomyces sp. NPDC000983 TaxID=3154373 RepID=UPI00332CFB61
MEGGRRAPGDSPVPPDKHSPYDSSWSRPDQISRPRVTPNTRPTPDTPRPSFPPHSRPAPGDPRPPAQAAPLYVDRVRLLLKPRARRLPEGPRVTLTTGSARTFVVPRNPRVTITIRPVPGTVGKKGERS